MWQYFQGSFPPEILPQNAEILFWGEKSNLWASDGKMALALKFVAKDYVEVDLAQCCSDIFGLGLGGHDPILKIL